MNRHEAHELARTSALEGRPWEDVAAMLAGLDPELVAIARRTYDNTRSSRARRTERSRDRLANARLHVAAMREILVESRSTGSGA